jgi:drug/metabolite transporter (DMT)-like permease
MNALKAFTDFLSLPAWNLAIYFLKIGDAVAITYLTPLISAFLAIFFLKEKLNPKKWMCLLLGLVGAYIILSPNSSDYNYYSIFALLSCLCWAAANVMTKHLANIKQHPAIIVFYGNIIVFALSMPFFLFKGRMLNMEELGLVMLMSFFACGGHFCLAWAYTKTKMTNLLPIDYSRLLFSVAYGYIFFGEIIGVNTLIGTAIILGASIYLSNQIRRTNKQEAKI